MVFDLYVAGESYFDTNAARLENVFHTPEHFHDVHAVLRNSGRSWGVRSGRQNDLNGVICNPSTKIKSFVVVVIIEVHKSIFIRRV